MWKLATVQSSNTNPILMITRAKKIYRLPYSCFFFRKHLNGIFVAHLATLDGNVIQFQTEFIEMNLSKLMDVAKQM